MEVEADAEEVAVDVEEAIADCSAFTVSSSIVVICSRSLDKVLKKSRIKSRMTLSRAAFRTSPAGIDNMYFAIGINTFFSVSVHCGSSRSYNEYLVEKKTLK